MKIIVRTSDLPRREEDDKLRPGGGIVMTGRPPRMSPIQYIGKYGTQEEVAEIVRKIEARRAKLPPFTYWVCQSCGWKSKGPYDDRDFEPDVKKYCLRCNSRLYVDGGIMRQMSKKEAAQYEKDVAEDFKKGVERTKRAAFYAENENRQKQGLEPLTRQEWDENRRRGWQLERSAYKA
jgi:hypothetical protein